MKDRWVPTGREFDDSAQSPIPKGRPGRTKRLLDKVLGRPRTAHHHLEVRAGVGEAREVLGPPSAVFDQTAAGSPAEAPSAPPPASESALAVTGIGAPAPQVDTQAHPSPKAGLQRSSSGVAHATPVTQRSPSPPQARRRRQMRVKPGVAPEIDVYETGGRGDDKRVGNWERGLDEQGLRRHIGPIQNYGDDT